MSGGEIKHKDKINFVFAIKIKETADISQLLF